MYKIRVTFKNEEVKSSKILSSDFLAMLSVNYKKGLAFCGFVPVKYGPSGKLLELDVLFKSRKPSERNWTFVTTAITFNNKKSGSSTIPDEYLDVIEETEKHGAKYLGFLPLEYGPSGKLLSIYLVFLKEN